MAEERKLNNISKIVKIDNKIYNISYCNEFDGIRFDGKDTSMTKCEFIQLYGDDNKGLCLEIAEEHCKALRKSMEHVTDPIARGMFLVQEVNLFGTALKNIGIGVEL